MTDPAKSIQVEDVLSSIRRIVTDDTGGEMRAEATAQAEESDTTHGPSGRFLLTPALRVPQSPSETPATREADAARFDGVSDGVDRAEPEEGAPPSGEVASGALLLGAAQRVTDPEVPCDPPPVAGDTDDRSPARDEASESTKPFTDTSAPHDVGTGHERRDASPDLAGVDPEVLRAVVAEIVRQELQGVLGERVTRNVRKLVRREINRVLTAREFD